MNHITSREINYSADAVALGNFDGLHRGHQELIHVAKESKRATVFSFFPPPMSVLMGAELKTIITSEEKAFLLDKIGVSLFIEYPFDKEISVMSPENFVKDILVGQLHCRVVVIGEDYQFGQDGRGDCKLMYMLGRELGFEVKIISPIMQGGSKISSTRVREAVVEREFEEAERLMGRPYFIMGKVIRGDMLGRSIGAPTANLAPAKHKLLPPAGVYRSSVLLDDKKFLGMTNVGTRPTVTDSTNAKVIVETHILDFDGDIYGQTITVEFRQWIRPESKFQSLDDLRLQIMRDVAAVKAVRTTHRQTQNSETPG